MATVRRFGTYSLSKILIDLYLIAVKAKLRGAFPVGGGLKNTISLSQGLDLISSITGKPFGKMGSGVVRPGDEPYFVADLQWAKDNQIDWAPKVDVHEGTGIMIDWIQGNLPKIRNLVAMRMRKRVLPA